MRRSNTVGNPMLVKLPIEGYENTHEGGMAFYLVIRCKDKPYSNRQTCIAGCLVWPQQDCLLKPQATLDRRQLIDGGLLIGSTGQSLWKESGGFYFIATLKDLTPEGKRLYHTLKRLYGKVDIVTLLDT